MQVTNERIETFSETYSSALGLLLQSNKLRSKFVRLSFSFSISSTLANCRWNKVRKFQIQTLSLSGCHKCIFWWAYSYTHDLADLKGEQGSGGRPPLRFSMECKYIVCSCLSVIACKVLSYYTSVQISNKRQRA